jgi:hypothetical protein
MTVPGSGPIISSAMVAPAIHTMVRGGKLSPLPRRVVHTTADYPAREHILGIYLPLEFLADPTRHGQCTLWRHVSLELKDAEIELSETLGDGQIRCIIVIWATWVFVCPSQSFARAHVPYGTADPRPVEGGRCVGGRTSGVFGRRDWRCRRLCCGRRLLRGAATDCQNRRT